MYHSPDQLPDVVQALNVMALSTQILAMRWLMAVLSGWNTTFEHAKGTFCNVNWEPLHTGRGDLVSFRRSWRTKLGTDHDENAANSTWIWCYRTRWWSCGASSAIYARKGLRVAIVAERIGGQVNDTTGIENLISVTKRRVHNLRWPPHPYQWIFNRCIRQSKVVLTNLKEAVKTVSVRGDLHRTCYRNRNRCKLAPSWSARWG